jgi:dienelactone hydrolase
MRKMISAAVLMLAAAAVQAKVVGTPFDYQSGTTTLKGYLAVDDAVKGPRPAVLVVHEWWGLNDHARKSADKLAALGYTALAVDMYGDGKTAAHPKEAGAFSKAAFDNFPQSKARFEAAMNALKKQPTVDPSKIAAIGYCFGGGVALNVARQGEDLKGVVTFHGNLMAVQPAQKGMVKAKVLVCQGGADQMTLPQVDGFKKEMDAAGADYKVIVYPGATHSWTNPDADEKAKQFNLPFKYNPEATQKSWQDMQDFLKDVFK